jgi:hypothetical protein
VNGKATFAVSRHLGEENAPKTRASRRTVTLLPNVIEVLKTLLPLRVSPESYVFTDADGRPIDQSEFARGFQVCCECSRLGRDHSITHAILSLALL